MSNSTVAQGANQCHGNCDCNPIYRNNDHTTVRQGIERILGDRQDFCAAFYHVNEWRRPPRERLCLNEGQCIISMENPNNRRAQPRKVVAVAKYENGGETLYEARYTNCAVLPKRHAEDFFAEDVQNGVLAKKIKENRSGTLTIYLTLQPCNWSTTINHGGTECTQQYHSCCETLTRVFTEHLQPDEIRLCVKPTHLCRLEVNSRDANDTEYHREHKDVQAKDVNEHLRRNAVGGIRMLMGEGVDVSAMTPEDWQYLVGMVEPGESGAQQDIIFDDGPRDALDNYITHVLDEVQKLANVPPPQA